MKIEQVGVHALGVFKRSRSRGGGKSAWISIQGGVRPEVRRKGAIVQGMEIVYETEAVGVEQQSVKGKKYTRKEAMDRQEAGRR